VGCGSCFRGIHVGSILEPRFYHTLFFGVLGGFCGRIVKVGSLSVDRF
jgi:hypothetical protein